ncbi:MAG: hypothetical protein HYX78_14080 [Armatimonadetes bacterium]|nr:hypothetical protein [Armatimonadota bacterium]
MPDDSLLDKIRQSLEFLPMMDVHTHLVGGNLGAKGIHDILLYHMAISDLYSAGCPSGSRLTQYPGWPTKEEAHTRIREALPYLKHVRNTSISWGIRMILSDLYGWNQEITEDNWETLDAIIRERADDRAWQRQVMRMSNIARYGTELARREDGQDDDILQYSLEWGFFTRCQWGEYDTALYELERCWGMLPGPPTPIGGGKRPATERIIRTLDDAHEAIAWYVEHIPYDQVTSMATHVSTDIDFRPVSDAEMRAALERRESAGPMERDVYASYINGAFLSALEEHADEIVFQFSFGAEPLPYETASRLSQETIVQVAEMIGRHPKLKFQCFLSSLHANQSMCTLCRELPNLSLAGYWWHNFFPSSIRKVMEERLDMLPVNKQVGFFSDAYCIEWTYGKARIVKEQLARVLADKVESRQYDPQMAEDIARDVLLETPKRLLGMVAAQA